MDAKNSIEKYSSENNRNKFYFLASRVANLIFRGEGLQLRIVDVRIKINLYS